MSAPPTILSAINDSSSGQQSRFLQIIRKHNCLDRDRIRKLQDMRKILLVALVLISMGCNQRSDQESTSKPTIEKPAVANKSKKRPAPVTESPEALAAQAKTVQEQLLKFVETPGRELYLSLRQSIVSSKAYDPYSDEIEKATEMLGEQRIKEAEDFLEKSMGNLLLSPRAHVLLATAYAELGDDERASAEHKTADACIQGILATGDGSESKPYVVLRTSDEYDIIRHLKLVVRNQALQEKDGKFFDVIDCGDDSQLWFDLTDTIRRLGKSLGR